MATETSFRDLVARLNAMSNITPEEERAQLMEAAGKAPKVLDDKDITLADIAKLAGIKEYVEPAKVSAKAEKLVESITAEPKAESVITKAILESDADDSIATSIKKTMTEESNRLDKIAELEAQLAELKSAQKEEQTHDTKSFRELVSKDVAEYIKNAEDSALVELYNTISDNEAVYNEESSSILVKTPDTAEIIADAEKAEAPEEIVQEKDAEKDEKEDEEDKDDNEEGEAEKSSKEKHQGRVDVHSHLDDDEDMGEDVELPTEDRFTNDLDPQK
jgi:hypothetical protein